ncbi:MAG: MarR family winged helix-turn-helix transcriptional regulator [Lysinibacillus sp.]
MSASQNELRQLFILLKNIDRRVTHAFEKRTRVSVTRYEILFALAENGHMIQTTLQQMLAIDQAAVTRHLKNLEELNLVTRRRNELNHREVLVAISEKGKQLLDSCGMDKEQFMEDLYQGFTPDEIQQLAGLMNRLNENAEAL